MRGLLEKLKDRYPVARFTKPIGGILIQTWGVPSVRMDVGLFCIKWGSFGFRSAGTVRQQGHLKGVGVYEVWRDHFTGAGNMKDSDVHSRFKTLWCKG